MEARGELEKSTVASVLPLSCLDWCGITLDIIIRLVDMEYRAQTAVHMYLVDFPCSMGLIDNHGEISMIIECGGNIGRICCSSSGFITNILNAVQEYCQCITLKHL